MMKKKYEAPKVEKMEFNYAETVVASNTSNPTVWYMTNDKENCEDVNLEKWNYYKEDAQCVKLS